MEKKKRKRLFWTYKLIGIFISCALPIWTICDRFPLWMEDYGVPRTAGIGIILITTVLLIVFRKTVFDFLRDHFKLHHAPPLAVWLGLLIFSYILVYIGEVMRDMTSVFWMGLIGCGIGTVFTFVSEKYKDKEVLEVIVKGVKSDE